MALVISWAIFVVVMILAFLTLNSSRPGNEDDESIGPETAIQSLKGPFRARNIQLFQSQA